MSFVSLYSPTLPTDCFVVQFSRDTSLDWMFDLICDQHDYDGLAIMMVSCVQTNVWGKVTNIRSETSNEYGGLEKTEGQVTDWTLMISPDCNDRWCPPPPTTTTILSHFSYRLAPIFFAHCRDLEISIVDGQDTENMGLKELYGFIKRGKASNPKH